MRLKPSKAADEAEKAGGDEKDDSAEDNPEHGGDDSLASSVEHGAQTASGERLRADDDSEAFAELGQCRLDAIKAGIYGAGTDVGHMHAIFA